MKYNKILTKEFLQKEYVENRKSLCEIAEDIGCTYTTVRHYVMNHDIPRHGSWIRGRKWQDDTSESANCSSEPNFKLTPIVKNYIDGLLLGDGYLHVMKRSKETACYEQQFAPNRREWADKIVSDFCAFGIKTKWRVYRPYPYLVLFTRCYPEFFQFRERWYPDGKKVVPHDLEFTPQLLANWFMGDGGLKKGGQIYLYTFGFTTKEVAFLCDKLNRSLNIDSAIHFDKGYPYIMIRKADASAFLDYIAEFKIGCFAYKWDRNESSRGL